MAETHGRAGLRSFRGALGRGPFWPPPKLSGSRRGQTLRAGYSAPAPLMIVSAHVSDQKLPESSRWGGPVAACLCCVHMQAQCGQCLRVSRPRTSGCHDGLSCRSLPDCAVRGQALPEVLAMALPYRFVTASRSRPSGRGPWISDARPPAHPGRAKDVMRRPHGHVLPRYQ